MELLSEGAGLILVSFQGGQSTDREREGGGLASAISHAFLLGVLLAEDGGLLMRLDMSLKRSLLRVGFGNDCCCCCFFFVFFFSCVPGGRSPFFLFVYL